MNYSPTIGACSCCGHTKFTFSTVLWQSLIDEWRLANYEVEYINRQQGLKCENCQSSLRTMALAIAIMKCFGYEGLFQDFVLTEQAQKLKVLEINEAGQLTRYLAKIPGHVLTSYPEVDMIQMPFQDGSFDLVVHADTLEHVKYPIKALSECYRVLKPGKFLAFTIPMVVDRLTSSREGLSPSYHAGAEDINSVLVYTEYGGDAWKHVIKAGFNECRIFSLEYPSAQVLVGVKLVSAYIDNVDEQLRVFETTLLSQRQALQAQLKQAQDRIELLRDNERRSHSQQQQTQVELEQARSQLQQTQTESKQAQLQLQLQLQQTQVELEQAQSQLQQTQAQLERSQSLLHRDRIKLEQLQTVVIAMQTSKFWQLRALWFKVKSRLKFTDLENEIALNLEEYLEPSSSGLLTQNPNYLTPSQDDDRKQVFSQIYASSLKSFLYSGDKLVLPSHKQPLVTVILVLYNRAELTFQCLRSLSENWDNSIEIVIVDNASTDDTSILLDRLEGARIIRNSENLHFLLASNQAANEAQGKYILFLNNDAQVLPGSIASAVKTIESSDDIGAVGGKIMLLDGSLQEAGGIIWRDACCQGYGRGDSPFAPMYMFVRDVDYCSGAFLLTRRDLFLQMGSFDTDYQPAYYEETDYCLRLWQLGKRVVYDPDAVILHFEFASSKSSGLALQLQADNREIFANKHRERLKSHYSVQDSNILLARSAKRYSRRVLFIEDRVPHAFLGTGYPRSQEILSALLELNCFVTLYPLIVYNEDWDSVYQDIPKVVEVMQGYGSANLEEFLRQRQGYYDLIIVSRPHNMQVLKPILTKNKEWFAKTKIIYDAEAVFSLREITKLRLKGKEISQKEIDVLVSDELKLATGVNCVISVSEAESKNFIKYGFEKVITLGYTVPANPGQNSFENRFDILFVGTIQDESSPNADAVYWFAKEIFPRIRDRLQEPDVKFTIVGSNSVSKILNLANNEVKVIGRVDDLNYYYNQARIFVAPSRFAAGIPIKVYDAAAHGLPIVTTSLIASQVSWEDGAEILVADDPSLFAEKCVKLYSDPELWEKLRVNALNRIQKECSKEAFITKLKDILID